MSQSNKDQIILEHTLDKNSGLFINARQCPSLHHDMRETNPAENGPEVSLLVIHNISLPPQQFGGPYIDQLFTGCLNPSEHPYFAEIASLRVSSHLLIRRDGELVQYVPLHLRAWHAGVSCFDGQEKCNNYSIGIELEGADNIAYEEIQYQILAKVTRAIQQAYPAITDKRITGHNDIAPGRKTDPGDAFDWGLYRWLLEKA